MLTNGSGYYVYGIARQPQSKLDPRALPEHGIDPAYPVYVVPYQSTQAVVSVVSLDEFGQEELEQNLRDIGWLESKVRAHENILESLLTTRSVIPMRFGTIFSSEGHIQEMLAEHQTGFVDTLRRLEDKREWGVKVYADCAVLTERVRDVSDKIRTIETEMAGKSTGAAYIWKKRLDSASAEEMERVIDECADRCHDRLSRFAEEAITSPPRTSDVTGRSDEMILNGAYLVTEERLTELKAELAALQEEYGSLGFCFELCGPWPPYSFV